MVLICDFHFQFCGSIIAGLSILSDSVMRLRHEKQNNLYADFLLKKRSLYIMKYVYYK